MSVIAGSYRLLSVHNVFTEKDAAPSWYEHDTPDSPSPAQLLAERSFRRNVRAHTAPTRTPRVVPRDTPRRIPLGLVDLPLPNLRLLTLSLSLLEPEFPPSRRCCCFYLLLGAVPLRVRPWFSTLVFSAPPLHSQVTRRTKLHPIRRDLNFLLYRVFQKTFRNIFTSVKSFCVKFCQFGGNSTIFFYRFILIFHQMALIFLRVVSIVFTLSTQL